MMESLTIEQSPVLVDSFVLLKIPYLMIDHSLATGRLTKPDS